MTRMHVIIDDVGGKVRTVPTDFVTASLIVRAARLAGRHADIRPWEKSDTREWMELLESGEALVASISLFEGTCLCTAKQVAEKIRVLVPLGVVQEIGNGQAFFLEPLAPLQNAAVASAADVPPGSADGEDPYFTPPDPLGFAKEPNDG